MDKDKYKAAIDTVKFSPDFERDTIELLRRAAGGKAQKEEKEQMNMRKILRVPVLAVLLIALFAVTALALSVLLSPQEVATQAGDKGLAEAFASADAVRIDQSVQAGDYTITLQGIVSGKGLTAYDQQAQADRRYIVASVACTDGREITEVGETGISFSPLVSGYKPWQVNAWTLNGGYSAFVRDGVNYYLFDCANLEIFADHTVYLAAYEGFAPSAQIFTFNQNGEIAFNNGFTKPHAMFTLPLDPAKANPEAVNRLLESAGVVIQ